MKTLGNLGHHERIIRIGIGMAFLAFSGFSVLPGWGDLLLMGVGLIALLTGIIGYCPAWHTMGINTCKVDHDHSHSNTHSDPMHTVIQPLTTRKEGGVASTQT